MILRRFSADRHRVGMVTLKDGRRLDAVSIKDQCQRDYFYGSDNVMEQSFAREEARVASLLGDLSRDRLAALEWPSLYEIRQFVAYQYGRTLAAAERANEFVMAFVKSALRETLVLNADPELPPSDLDLVDIRLRDASSEAIWQTTLSLPLWLDLEVKFLLNERSQGFVVGDHPVVAYNQFIEQHPSLRRYPTSTGLATKGIQFFMPVSPGATIAVYDSATYEYAGKGRTSRVGPADVRFLNRMQAVNARSCLYFDPLRMEQSTVEDLVSARSSHPSTARSDLAKSQVRDRGDGTLGQFVVVSRRDVRVGASFSFVRTTDGHSYASHVGSTPPTRSAALLDVARMFREKLEKEVEERRSAKADGESSA